MTRKWINSSTRQIGSGTGNNGSLADDTPISRRNARCTTEGGRRGKRECTYYIGTRTVYTEYVQRYTCRKPCVKYIQMRVYERDRFRRL